MYRLARAHHPGSESDSRLTSPKGQKVDWLLASDSGSETPIADSARC